MKANLETGHVEFEQVEDEQLVVALLASVISTLLEKPAGAAEGLLPLALVMQENYDVSASPWDMMRSIAGFLTAHVPGMSPQLGEDLYRVFVERYGSEPTLDDMVTHL